MADRDRYREGEKRLKLAGFHLIRQSGHRIWEHPDKRRVVVPSSPGEGRGWQNMNARLKRLGVPELNQLLERNVYIAPPTVESEPLVQTGVTPQLGIVYRRNLIRNRGAHQVSVSEVLSAAETLKGKHGGLGQKEKWQALGKVLYLWLDQNTDFLESAIEFASTLEPDYETVFRGEFNCRVPGCGKKLFTPASQGAHERRIHGYVHQQAEPTQIAPAPERPLALPSVHQSPLRAKTTQRKTYVRAPRAFTGRTKHYKCRICGQEGHNARTCMKAG